jgi:peroxiredoxin
MRRAVRFERSPSAVTTFLAAVRFACAAVLAGTLLLLPAGPAMSQKIPKLEPSRGTRPGNLAREFSLKALDGRSYDLKDLIEQERVVHLVFWATWCIPCIQEIPHLREAYDKYHDRGLEVLGVVVNREQSLEGVRAFVKDYEVNYPILWDEAGEATHRYRVDAIPQNFLIGKDGIIRHAGNALPGKYHALLEEMLEQNGRAETSESS